MELTEIIGITASVFTAVAMLPQLVKMLKEKKAEGISVMMLSVLCTGLALWIFYGIRKEDWIIIISNAFSLVINLTTMYMSIKYKKKS